MHFTLYTADCRENARNIRYPNPAAITTAADLKKATAYDHVCAQYADGIRKEANFQFSDVLPMDCDNDHSDNPNDWLTPERLAQLLPDVAFAATYSRHHMQAKGKYSARPRFHVFFPTAACTNAATHKAMKLRIQKALPFFDGNALDAARFLFGASGEVFWQEGSLHYMKFLEQSTACNPPLSDTELQQIWKSAERFGTQIAKQKGYIAPEHYGQLFQFRPEDYSDLGQAKIFAGQVQGELAYTDATEYLCYQKNHWVESKQLAVGRCEAFLDTQLEEAERTLEMTHKMLLDSGVDAETISKGGKVLEKAVDDISRKAYIEYRSALTYRTFVMKRRDMKYISATLQAAKPMLLKDIADFDSQAFLLNTPTATYDLQKGVNGGRPHNPEDYLTKMTAVSPNNVGEEIWKDALHCFFCGDQSLTDYVQQICGLCAIGKVYQEALMIAYGEGSNGKSTFWNAISRVLGSYSGTMSADALTVGCKQNVKSEMAELKDKRLVIAAELEEGITFSLDLHQVTF